MTTTITVSTTLPVIEDHMIQPFKTSRLVIRPLRYPTDLDAYHKIRRQAAAMTSSRTGLPDATREQTEAKLKRLQPPYCNSHVYFGIFLRDGNDGTEGELIGDGGVHKFAGTETGWPEFGYKFKQEHWGRGYATEFARAFMVFWWNLPCIERRIEVVRGSVSGLRDGSSGGGGGGLPPGEVGKPPLRVAEQVCAWTTAENKASQKVLRKAGFEPFEGVDNGLVNWRCALPRQGGILISSLHK